MKGVKEWEIGN